MGKVPSLTSKSFDLLLARLDADRDAAAEKYELLRLKLIRCFEWKGCAGSDADHLADQTLDRVAEKLSIVGDIDNLAAYSAAIARFVWLEHCRKHREDAAGDDLPEIAVQPDRSIFDEVDERLKCLTECLAEVASDDRDRQLIVGYYDTDPDGNYKENRKKLAAAFGITANHLKVRACRLRAKLETCINECVNRVTKLSENDTTNREVM